MGSSILTSLMVSGIGTSGKIGTVRKQDGGDSFLGIFSEKLQERANATDKGSKPRVSGQEGSYTTFRKAQSRERNTVAEKPMPGDKAENVTEQRAASKASSAADEQDNSSKPEKKELTDELASLLESLLIDLDRLLTVWRSSGETTAVVPSMHKAGDPLEALQAIVSGRLEQLQALLERLQAISQDGGQDGFLALLDEVDALVSKLQQIENLSHAAAGVDLEATLEADGETLEALIAQLQSQCRQIADKLRNGQTGEAGQNLALEAEAGQDSVSVQTTEEADMSRTDDQKPEQSGQKAEKAEKSNTPGKTNSTVMETAGQDTQALEGSDFVPQNQQAVSAEIQTEKNTPVTGKTFFYLSDKQIGPTIVNQVVMKVRLMAGENRQELEMHLKPESLGKLTLKIIHERGEVLARITAENEQVKAILESNMQLLKDALEKNGYTVQSLDVSVADRNGGNQAAQTHQREHDRREGAARESTGGRPIRGVARANPGSTLYDLDMPGISQQIDLTA